jgi:hypothetical protein
MLLFSLDLISFGSLCRAKPEYIACRGAFGALAVAFADAVLFFGVLLRCLYPFSFVKYIWVNSRSWVSFSFVFPPLAFSLVL